MQSPADPLPLTDGDREILTRLAASQTASLRLVMRAKVLLMAGDGVANSLIAERTGLSVGTVRTWRARFLVDQDHTATGLQCLTRCDETGEPPSDDQYVCRQGLVRHVLSVDS